MQGRVDEADGLLASARAAMGEAAIGSGSSRSGPGFIGVWLDDPTAAERELRPAYEALGRPVRRLISRRSRTRSPACSTYRAATTKPRSLTLECERASRPNDVHAQTLWRSVRAKILARKQAFGEAERLAREAVAFAAAGDFLPANADALADLAEVLELMGRPDEAARTLEEAIELYERKGNTLAADRVKCILTGLR